MNQLSFIGIASISIHLIVRLLKAGKLGEKIPSAYRPWIVAILGGIAVAVDALALGTEWKQAVFNGVMSAAMAAFGHDLVIESLRGGKEIGE